MAERRERIEVWEWKEIRYSREQKKGRGKGSSVMCVIVASIEIRFQIS